MDKVGGVSTVWPWSPRDLSPGVWEFWLFVKWPRPRSSGPCHPDGVMGPWKESGWGILLCSSGLGSLCWDWGAAEWGAHSRKESEEVIGTESGFEYFVFKNQSPSPAYASSCASHKGETEAPFKNLPPGPTRAQWEQPLSLRPSPGSGAPASW